jgi:biotin synthase-like enzyme
MDFSKELVELLPLARKTFEENFDNSVFFERAIFFSWGCSIGDCTFCYMSTQPKEKVVKETKRSNASILAEFLLAKHLGWDIGFFTGGIGVFAPKELEDLLKSIYAITQEKIWLSVGPLPKPLIETYLPYIKGVVGSTETINPRLHKIVCPSKPLAPYEKMFVTAGELGIKKAMTFIVGMGENVEDYPLLVNFIRKYSIDKIHVYSLIPQKDTIFERSKIPSAEEQAWWIAKLRVDFPNLDIQCGIWEDRLDRIPLLLNAGSNSISKFKATKLFGTKLAHDLENYATQDGRKLLGSVTKVPEVDWGKKIESLDLGPELKLAIHEKLSLYLNKMKKNSLLLQQTHY